MILFITTSGSNKNSYKKSYFKSQRAQLDISSGFKSSWENHLIKSFIHYSVNVYRR